MKLLVSYTSPFVRKTMMTIIEKGLRGDIELVPVNAWKNPHELVAANPLSQVPTLILDDGSALYDSSVICAWLDSLKPEPRLIPAEPQPRVQAMRMEALADGMTDAAVRVRMARVAAGAQPDTPEVARLFAKVEAALQAMQRDAVGFGTAVTLPQIAFGAALGYLDFRFGDLGWRQRLPQLATWYAGFARRPAMQETEPHE